MLGLSGQIERCLALLLLTAVLPWGKPDAAGRGGADTSINKAVWFVRLLICCSGAMSLLLAGLGGEGERIFNAMLDRRELYSGFFPPVLPLGVGGPSSRFSGEFLW